MELRQMFYSWPSIFRRFWANRHHPLYYFAMNFTHWWRAYRYPPQHANHPSVAPRSFRMAPRRWGTRLAVVGEASLQGSAEALVPPRRARVPEASGSAS